MEPESAIPVPFFVCPNRQFCQFEKLKSDLKIKCVKICNIYNAVIMWLLRVAEEIYIIVHIE